MRNTLMCYANRTTQFYDNSTAGPLNALLFPNILNLTDNRK